MNELSRAPSPGEGRALKVLHVVAAVAPRLGGPSKVAVEMCQALARVGVDVTLFATNLDEQGRWSPFEAPNILSVPTSRSVWANGVETRYFRTAWPSRFVFSPAMATELRRRIRSFDLVHIHSLYLFHTLIASHYAHKFKVPYMVRPHGTLDPYVRRRHRYRKALYNRLIERRTLNRAAAIHFTAQEELHLAKSFGIKAPGIVIPLGVDPEEFQNLPPPGSFRNLHPELAKKQLVVFLGRIAQKKGLDLLIRAFQPIATAFPHAHLVVAGPDDGYLSELKSSLARSSLQDRCTLTGLLVGREKLSLLADTDIWVLPSYTENFGMAVVEALACGLPVVISDRVNIHDQLTRAGAALVVPCDAEALGAAISLLLRNEAMRHRLGVAARSVVNDQFTWNAAAVKLRNVYTQICGRVAPPPALPRS